MPKHASRRDFLKRAGLLSLAVPGAAVALDACANVATSAKASTIRVGWTIEPDTMNPMTSYSTEAVEVLQLVYDYLIGTSLALKSEPGLATSWAYSADGKTITYRLRSATWHDGKPFTSADVKFTFELIKSKQLSQYAQWVTQLASVDTPDAHTVALHFTQPQAFNPGLAVPILPQHIWAGMSASDIQKFANAHPVGTGPYKFVNWKHGQSIEVARNDDFWGPKPAAQKITWILFQNEDIMAQSLRTGAVDICPEIPPTIWDGLKGAPKVKTVSMESCSFHHIGINVSDNPKSGGNPLLKDRTIRLALSYAVDRQQLVNVALAGHGEPGSTILPSGLGDWHLDIPADQQYNANPAKARELLDAAGYTGPRRQRAVRLPRQQAQLPAHRHRVDLGRRGGGPDLPRRLRQGRHRADPDHAGRQLARLDGLQRQGAELGHLRLGLGLGRLRPRLHARRPAVQPDRLEQRRVLLQPPLRRALQRAGHPARPATSGWPRSTRRSSSTTTTRPTSSCGTRPSSRATGPIPGRAGPRRAAG